MAARKSASDVRELANVLYYGNPGSAKTTSLATMANLGPIVHIDAESGLKPTALRKRGIDLTNIEIWPDREQGEVLDFDGLDELYWELKGALEEDPDTYIGIMWDSTTETHKLFLESVVGKGVEKAERKGMDRDEFDTYQEDWGKMTEQMRRLLRRYRDLPCHFGVSALIRRDQDNDGKVRYGPAVNPALQSDMMGYVDIVCFTFTEEVPGWGEHDEMFLGRVRAGGKYDVKDRFDVLPTVMVEPTMERIIAYINGELTIETDPRQQEAREVRESLDTEETEVESRPKKRPAKKRRPRKIADEKTAESEGDEDE